MATRRVEELKEAIDVLEAERITDTVQLRHDLVRECSALLPEAIRQAKPKPSRKRKDGTRTQPRPGSPALLRLISRVAMRDVKLDRPPKK